MNHSFPLGAANNNYSSLSQYKNIVNSAQKSFLPETTGVLLVKNAAGFPSELRLITDETNHSNSDLIKSTKQHFVSSILETPGILRCDPEKLSEFIDVNNDSAPLTIRQIKQVFDKTTSLAAWVKHKILEIKTNNSISSGAEAPKDAEIQKILKMCSQIPEINRQIHVEQQRVDQVLNSYFQNSPIKASVETIQSLNFLDPKDRSRFEQETQILNRHLEKLKKLDQPDTITTNKDAVSNGGDERDPAENLFRDVIPIELLEPSVKKLLGHYDSLKKSIEQVEEHTPPHATPIPVTIGKRIETNREFHYDSHDQGTRLERQPNSGAVRALQVRAVGKYPGHPELEKFFSVLENALNDPNTTQEQRQRIVSQVTSILNQYEGII